MSFIAKNPLILPETNKSLSVPHGTKGLVMTPDGLVIVDFNAKVDKVATKEYVDSAIDDSVITYSYNAETKTLSLSAENSNDIE